MSNVLVTGGAGGIRRYACKTLGIAGFAPATFDNLINGWQDAVELRP